MASLRTAYLLSYNSLQAMGWAVALYQLLAAFIRTGTPLGAHDAAGDTVALFQLVSALEIVHAGVGLVGGSPVPAAMQWAGRSNVLFGVARSVGQVQRSAAVGVMLLVWALSEVVRYPWYAASIAGTLPYWLTWLRYTVFVPLYPVGVVAEMLAVYEALPLIGARSVHSVALPNAWNIGFDYRAFLTVLMVVYPVLWWQLYSTLLRQRRRRLGLGALGARRSSGQKLD